MHIHIMYAHGQVMGYVAEMRSMEGPAEDLNGYQGMKESKDGAREARAWIEDEGLQIFRQQPKSILAYGLVINR